MSELEENGETTRFRRDDSGLRTETRGSRDPYAYTIVNNRLSQALILHIIVRKEAYNRRNII